jgi:hypothetical protein
METKAEDFTGFIIRFGGLVPTYFITDHLHTCHLDEAKVFMYKDQAEEKAKELYEQYGKGRVIKKP